MRSPSPRPGRPSQGKRTATRTSPSPAACNGADAKRSRTARALRRAASRCSGLRAVSAARNFVQAAKRQPAPGQASVKFGQAERQRRLWRAVVALDSCDPLPQRHESRIGSGRGHGSVGLLSEGDSGLYVHHSFHKPRMSIRRMAFVILPGCASMVRKFL